MEEALPDQQIDASSEQITERLTAWATGDAAALDDVIRAVYRELRRMADHYLRLERPGHTLQPTALVHEAYLRMVDQTRVSWQNRAHFFGVAAQMMRRILVDHARTKHRDKRGGSAAKLSLDEALNLEALNLEALNLGGLNLRGLNLGGLSLSEGRETDLVALDDALESLAEIDARKSRVVELRFFGGLSVEETAEVLGVSPHTVMRDWKLAKAWLYQRIKGEARDDA
jgi:RNA polymerase sigma factor (sigma-70 family)